jgi:hypothetical protein
MSGIVSAIIGGQAQENVASTQAGTSEYATNVGAKTSEEEMSNQLALAGIGQQTAYGTANIGAKTSEDVAKISSDTSKYGTDVGAKTAEQQLAEKSKEYLGTQDIATKQLADAASGIQDATASAPSELLQEKSDIENKNTRELQDISKQVGANLATSGVRGGQAATLQNRAVGEAGINAQNNIDELLAQDAAQRRSAKTGFYTTVAGGSIGKV